MGQEDRDWSYLNEKDATDVSVLNVCSEGVIRHPPAAVLKVRLGHLNHIRSVSHGG